MNPISTYDQLAYLRLLLDSTAEGFYAVNNQGQTTLCNAAFLQMLRFSSRDEVIGKKLHGDIHHTHPNGLHYDVGDCPIYQAASSGKQAFVPYELFFRTDGTSFPVEYRAEPVLEDGEPRGAICTFRDISDRLQKEAEKNRQTHERREAEAQLHSARERYERLFNNINQGFCLIEVMFDEKGKAYDYKFLETNKAFEQQSGTIGAVGKTMREIALCMKINGSCITERSFRQESLRTSWNFQNRWGAGLRSMRFGSMIRIPIPSLCFSPILPAASKRICRC